MNAVPIPQLPDMSPDPAYVERLGSHVPAELRQLSTWVCWKWAPAPRRKDADPSAPTKLTKVPYNPRSGAKAAVDNPLTWAPFAEALDVYRRGGYAGLGLVFTPDASLVGVDLDKCRDAQTGELAPWAADIIRRLASYAEISPSGTGVHILICAALPEGATRSRKGAVEVYASRRFFTVTGAHLDGTPAGIEERGRAFAEWYGEVFAPNSKASTPPAPVEDAASGSRPRGRPGDPPTLSDAQIIDHAMRARNAAKFSALWRGETAGYASASEADMALLMMLRFYVQDPVRLDRLFRQSGLFRDKWDTSHYSTGETYGEHCITVALAGLYEIWAGRAARRTVAAAPRAALPAPAIAPDEASIPPVTRSKDTAGDAPGNAQQRPPFVPGDGGGDGTGAEMLAGAIPLRATRSGSLWYAPEAYPPGLYLVPHRAPPYCLLSARVDPLRLATHPTQGRSGRGNGSVYHFAFTPDLTPASPITVQLTRDEAISGGAYSDSGLENMCSHAPADKTDLALTWQALTAYASIKAASSPALRARTAPGLGWHNGAYIRVNGYIDRDGAHLGDDIIVSGVSPEWPQTLPAELAQLPSVIDAGLIRNVLAFWPERVARYPLALWGACAFIMRPYTDGRASWELEVFGPTGSGKTALTNAVLRAFYGAGYTYFTATQLTAGRASDTGPGRTVMRSRLRHQAYMTYDHNARPGQSEYEKQQQDRIDSADAAGNRILGGAKSTRDGGLEMRPQPMGLLIRTGEADPHDYSVAQLKTSSDARCVTFVLDTGLGMLGNVRGRSRAIFDQAAQLDALSIAYACWLATIPPAEAVEQWHRMRAQAAQMVGRVDGTGAYPMRHERSIEQCEDIVAGLLSYAAFLRAVDLDTGADGGRMVQGGAALAGDLDAWAPELVREILAASHELMERHADMAGGESARATLARALCFTIRDGLTRGEWRVTAQDNDTAPALDMPVPPDLLGWERGAYGTDEWRSRTRSTPLGCSYGDGRYLACDKTALESLARTAAAKDRRITYSTLTRLLADLLAAGAVVGGNEREHPYTQQVRRPGYTRPPRMVCFSVEQIWPSVEPDNDTPDNAKTDLYNPILPGTPGTPGMPGTTQQYAEDEALIQAEWGEGEDSIGAEIPAAKSVPGGIFTPGTAQQYDAAGEAQPYVPEDPVGSGATPDMAASDASAEDPGDVEAAWNAALSQAAASSTVDTHMRPPATVSAWGENMEDGEL